MAIIKCKMCGGDLVIEPGSTVAECEYCGSRQTVPTADSEKKLTLFARANRLRLSCEFDKAAGIYESIVADFPEEAEAYWGLVLCKYGIEYVDDPATGKKIPTCHRSSFDSILEDSDFEQACENADTIARKVYREEAKQIEEIRKGIIEVSGKEEPYDIFICYKETAENGDRTIDSVIAQDVYDALVSKGYRVFFSRITLEDKLGQEYEPYIFAALNSAKIMLAFGTDYEYYNAVWVKNEWSRYLKLMASDKTKHLIPCYKGIDAYDMPKEFAKLQAQDMGKIGAMQDLLRGIEKILPKTVSVNMEQAVAAGAPGSPSMPLLRRANMFLEDRDWDSASAYFEKVLDLDPECGEAYLGKLLVELRLEKRTDLAHCEQPFDGRSNYQKAIRFGSEALKAELNGYLDQIQNIIREKKLRAEQERRERELREEQIREKARQEEEKHRALLLAQRTRIAPVQCMISAGWENTVGLKNDGTVISTRYTRDRKNYDGQCEVSGWTDIVAISAGRSHTVGLKSDGTVAATKYTGNMKYYMGQCDVSGWKDIVAISAGAWHTVGLKSNGTVVATKYIGDKIYNFGACDVSDWKDIVAVSAGYDFTVGLKSDGTVIATKYTNRSGESFWDYHGQCEVSDWKDIVAISAGDYHTVGLKSDGTVVAVGSNTCGKCNVSDWTDIVAISAGGDHTVGLKSDGTVVATKYLGEMSRGQCDVSDWKDIVAISASGHHTVGLKSNGTLVSTKYLGDLKNYCGQCDVSGWKLFNSIDTLEQEAAEIKKRMGQQRIEKTAALEREKASLQTELANLKGIFSGRRRKEIEAELAQIENELKGRK